MTQTALALGEDLTGQLHITHVSPRVGKRVMVYINGTQPDSRWYTICKAPGVRQYFAQHLTTGDLALIKAPSRAAHRQHFRLETQTQLVRILDKHDLEQGLREARFRAQQGTE